jgi:hypothetical protein
MWVGSARGQMREDFGASSFDIDYWLSRCEGYRVESEAGKLGVVEELRFGSRLDRPDELIVRAGFLGRRRVRVPVGDVERIITREKGHRSAAVRAGPLMLRSGRNRWTSESG